MASVAEVIYTCDAERLEERRHALENLLRFATDSNRDETEIDALYGVLNLLDSIASVDREELEAITQNEDGDYEDEDCCN